MNAWLLLIFTFLSAFFMGCGVSSSSSGGSINKTIEGIAVDPEISDASVGVDTNENGILDATEVLAKTDVNGVYSFQISQTITGKVLVSGGIDTATNQPFQGIIKSVLPNSSTTNLIVSPLTTLLADGMEQSKIKTLLNLDENIDLLKTNPNNNLNVLRAGAAIHSIANRIGLLTEQPTHNVYNVLATLSSFNAINFTSILNQFGSDVDGATVETSFQSITTADSFVALTTKMKDEYQTNTADTLLESKTSINSFDKNKASRFLKAELEGNVYYTWLRADGKIGKARATLTYQGNNDHHKGTFTFQEEKSSGTDGDGSGSGTFEEDDTDLSIVFKTDGEEVARWHRIAHLKSLNGNSLDAIHGIMHSQDGYKPTFIFKSDFQRNRFYQIGGFRLHIKPDDELGVNLRLFSQGSSFTSTELNTTYHYISDTAKSASEAEQVAFTYTGSQGNHSGTLQYPEGTRNFDQIPHGGIAVRGTNGLEFLLYRAGEITRIGGVTINALKIVFVDDREENILLFFKNLSDIDSFFAAGGFNALNNPDPLTDFMFTAAQEATPFETAELKGTWYEIWPSKTGTNESKFEATYTGSNGTHSLTIKLTSGSSIENLTVTETDNHGLLVSNGHIVYRKKKLPFLNDSFINALLLVGKEIDGEISPKLWFRTEKDRSNFKALGGFKTLMNAERH